MELYYMTAACSLAPHIIFGELGIAAHLVQVDQKPHRTEDSRNFLKLNPFGYVPLLELDDGTHLREGPAILQYLADLKPELGLALANGTMERYRLQECLSFLSSEIQQGFIPLLYARLAGTYGTDTAMPKPEVRFAWLDGILAESDYLLGASFTIADAYLYSLMQWGQAEWLEPTYRADIHFSTLDNLEAWYLRIRTRPAVRQALDIEGLR